jgi:hypothetical protein
MFVYIYIERNKERWSDGEKKAYMNKDIIDMNNQKKYRSSRSPAWVAS